jgi:hypothetical protein
MGIFVKGQTYMLKDKQIDGLTDTQSDTGTCSQTDRQIDRGGDEQLDI